VSTDGFSVVPIRTADDVVFDVAWGALHEEFEPRGEIERREVVTRWLENPGGYGAAGLRVTYHLVAVFDAEGELAAVRDHHVVVDADKKAVTVYLAHALVLPKYRRRGVARDLRRLATMHGEYAAEAAGIEAPRITLAAEMEPFDPSTKETATRLVAYGRDGFAVIDPARVLYRQPDFRDPTAIAGKPRSIPLLAVVRRIGKEGEPTLPREDAEDFVKHLYAVFATHCRASDLRPLAGRSYGALAAGGPLVPLLPLPTSMDVATDPLRGPSTADTLALEQLRGSRILPLYALN
jgi:GNAT superfamily N-acetyltransferase